MTTIEPAYDEQSEIVPSAGFDYEAVEEHLAPCPSPQSVEWDFGPEKLSAEELEVALALFRRLVGWQWQNGMKDAKGLQIRAIIVCWIFLEHLRPMTLTQIATGFGKHKQSLGRWVEDFKKQFPFIKTPHMQNGVSQKQTKETKN